MPNTVVLQKLNKESDILFNLKQRNLEYLGYITSNEYIIDTVCYNSFYMARYREAEVRGIEET